MAQHAQTWLNVVENGLQFYKFSAIITTLHIYIYITFFPKNLGLLALKWLIVAMIPHDGS